MNVYPSDVAVQKFETGEKVRTVDCPSVGVVVEAEKSVRIACGSNPGRREHWHYKIDWRPDAPNDHHWYPQETLAYPDYDDAFSR